MTTDDETTVTIDITEIRKESEIGLCVVIGDDLIWVPKSVCTWTPTTLTMTHINAKRHFVI